MIYNTPIFVNENQSASVPAIAHCNRFNIFLRSKATFYNILQYFCHSHHSVNNKVPIKSRYGKKRVIGTFVLYIYFRIHSKLFIKSHFYICNLIFHQITHNIMFVLYNIVDTFLLYFQHNNTLYSRVLSFLSSLLFFDQVLSVTYSKYMYII